MSVKATPILMKIDPGDNAAIDAPQSCVSIRTLQSLARHPDFGGRMMIVGLGCVKLPPERLADGNAASIVSLQQHRGLSAMVSRILEMAERHLKELGERRRVHS